MKRAFLIIAFIFCLLPLRAQVIVGNYSVTFVASAPSGSCSQNAPLQFVVPSGHLYGCQSGTWADITGSGGGGGTTTNPITFNNSGSGAASGTTFNGSVAQTISYNTIGAAAAGAGLPVGQLGQTVLNSSGGTTSYAASFASPFYFTLGANLIGDSLMQPLAGIGQVLPLTICRSVGGVCNDLAVSGSMAPDEAINQLWPNVQNNYTFPMATVIEAGVNDAQTGTVTYENNYQYTMQGMVAEAAIPNANKVWGNNCVVTGAGGASKFTTIPGIQGSQSTTNGTIWTCTTPTTASGTTKVDVAWWASDSNGGVASLSVDGQGCPGGFATLNASGFSTISTILSTTTTIFDTQCTVTSATSHSAVITVTSATGAGNKFALIFTALPYLSSGTVSPPPVYVYGVPFENGDTIGSTTAAFNTIASNVAAIYSGEGLPVKFVNTRAFANSSTSMQTTVANINGYQVTDGVSTTGSTAATITSATANFGPSVVPPDCTVQNQATCWPIIVTGAGAAGATLSTVIVGYTSATQVVIATGASTAASSETVTYGPPGTVTCGGNVAPLHPNCMGYKQMADAFNAVAYPGNTQYSQGPQFAGTASIFSTTAFYPAGLYFGTNTQPATSSKRATLEFACPTSTAATYNNNGTLIGANICAASSPLFIEMQVNGAGDVYSVDRLGTTTTTGQYNQTAPFTTGPTINLSGTLGSQPMIKVQDNAATAFTCSANGDILCANVAAASNGRLFEWADNNVLEAYLDRQGILGINELTDAVSSPLFPWITLTNAALSTGTVIKIQDTAATAATCHSNGVILCANVAATSNAYLYDWFDNATEEAFIDRQGQGFLNLNLTTPSMRLGASGAAACTAGTAGNVCATEGTAPTNVASTAAFYADSTAHEWKAKTAGSANAGLMVRAQPGSVRLTGQTGSVATATLCDTVAGACNVAGTYHVHFALYQSGSACSANTTNGVSVQLTWHDANGTAYSAVTLPMVTDASLTAFATSGVLAWGATTLGHFGTIDFNIDTNGTIIQYATTYANCTTGTATYAISGVVTRLQ